MQSQRTNKTAPTCKSRTEEDADSPCIHWTIFFYKALQNPFYSEGKIRSKQRITATGLKEKNTHIKITILLLETYVGNLLLIMNPAHNGLEKLFVKYWETNRWLDLGWIKPD